jgi:hypothetical protein
LIIGFFSNNFPKKNGIVHCLLETIKNWESRRKRQNSNLVDVAQNTSSLKRCNFECFLSKRQKTHRYDSEHNQFFFVARFEQKQT